MNYEHFAIDIDQRIATVRIDRPQALNAATTPMIRDLGAIMKALEADPSVAVIILTGSGDKAFMAGGDIAGLETLDPLQARDLALLAHDAFHRIENGPKPVIAAVNGFALGGGCELALACDIRIASERAKFGQPEVKIGIIPGFGGTQRLPRLVGPGAAKRMILSGEMIDAAEALRIGLVEQVVTPARLLEEARELAGTIAAQSASAVAMAKRAVNQGFSMDLNRACAFEAELFSLGFATQDQKEGMRAFLEKRKPDFAK